MLLSLLIVLIIVLVAGAFFLAPDNPDDGSPALLQGLSQIRSMAEGLGDEESHTTTVYKWQDADGEWHFSNTPPAQGIASQVQTYRADTNVIQAPQQQQKPAAAENNAPPTEPDPGIPGLPSPAKAKKLLDDARAVQDLNDNRMDMLNRQIDGSN
ncbi:MAG TPA: DUF4124 domain-containing protein [Gammaproteobacteria bacterium]|nr:DUF4124 domain-containing protein [Gammaproteobacteria bacterium]